MAARAKDKKTEFNRIRPLRLALAVALFLAASSLLPDLDANPGLAWSVRGATAALLLFLFLLHRQVAKTGRVLRYEFFPKPVHYVQLTMQACIYAYWGWYWREVYHQIPLIIIQIGFVYLLDMLVCWSRRDKWILGFGVFPIVLSTNLFLWFKPDWYFLQFLMLATGVLCKEFLTWMREGRRVHIFNPSAIALFVFSLALILTHSTPISWGEEIAVSFDHPPHIYLEIFLLGLVVQGLFSVTLVTLSAAASLYVLNLLYTHTTGVYFFVDTNIPAAVFLGLHLLVTDPATSPRKNLGKIVFGALYGVGVFGLYWLLTTMGAPTFYDKLLCVPPLNLMARWLDRVSQALADRVRLREWAPTRANYAHMAIWFGLFSVMLSTRFLGGQHPGTNPEFWRTACQEGRTGACESWVRMMNIWCFHGSGASCMMLGDALGEGKLTRRDLAQSAKSYAHACELGESSGCARVFRIVSEGQGNVFQNACDGGDGESCFLLGSLYYAGQGVPRDFRRAFALFQRSCSAGWPRGCSGLGESYRAGAGTAADSALAIKNFDKACHAGVAPSCFSASSMFSALNNEAEAEKRLRWGCELTLASARSGAAYFQTGAPSVPSKIPAACSSEGND